MQVIYRITDIPSTNPSPWSQEDKRKLNSVCLKSFVKAFIDVKPKIHFLADHCDKNIGNMIDEIVPFEFDIEKSEAGINATMLRSYELASKMDDYVLFQECDYLYRPKIGVNYLKALEKLDIISPYDHRNFYIDHTIHDVTCDIALIGEQHYRTTERNTMTWATHSNIVKIHLDTLMKYGYLDDHVWYDLSISDVRLWVPILSFATHCVKDYLAPGINWQSLWQTYQSQS